MGRPAGSLRLALLALVLLSGAAAAAPKASKYDEAVKLLGSPKTWCTGAKRLVALKDKRAVLPLMRAFESRMEAEKLCLAEAMEALGGEAEARALIASSAADDRRVALRLMVLFSSDLHLPHLRDAALKDPEPALRTRALDALRQQRRTSAWEQLIAELLDQPGPELRGWAIDRLAESGSASTRGRLAAHLPKETVPELRARIEAALRPSKP
ncbi:MAG TPA: HEAT repeat domain-containing protein [Kofleriaceae bacterium]|nr:HEAT repeat domain-containing protein [Kofleriaceae bacterium]